MRAAPLRFPLPWRDLCVTPCRVRSGPFRPPLPEGEGGGEGASPDCRAPQKAPMAQRNFGGQILPHPNPLPRGEGIGGEGFRYPRRGYAKVSWRERGRVRGDRQTAWGRSPPLQLSPAPFNPRNPRAPPDAALPRGSPSPPALPHQGGGGRTRTRTSRPSPARTPCQGRPSLPSFRRRPESRHARPSGRGRASFALGTPRGRGAALSPGRGEGAGRGGGRARSREPVAPSQASMALDGPRGALIRSRRGGRR